MCHSADGRILVIGTTEGRFIVLDGKLGSHLSTIQVATGAVDSTKISPGKYTQHQQSLHAVTEVKIGIF